MSAGSEPRRAIAVQTQRCTVSDYPLIPNPLYLRRVAPPTEPPAFL
jgi:hypothetical protein